MTPEFNRWWNADELTQTNPYNDDTPVFWAWEGWQAARSEQPDCKTCENRGAIDGLSQETHCDHCIYQYAWRTNHYAPTPEFTGDPQLYRWRPVD